MEEVTLITRKAAAAAVLVLFALILASCGGGATPTPTTVPATAVPPTTAPTEESATTLEATAEAATEEPAAQEAETEATEAAGDSSAAAEGGVTVTIAQIDTALRSGPGTAYEVVARTRVSETFPVTGQYGTGGGKWYQVTLPDGSSAWVWSRVATLNPADAEVPVIEEAPPTPASLARQRLCRRSSSAQTSSSAMPRSTMSTSV
jgi:hypothetical protein